MSDPIRTHFMKMWKEARNELIKAVEEFHNKDFKTDKGGTNDKDKEFYRRYFPKLKKAVENYERVYQIHKITDKIIKQR